MGLEELRKEILEEADKKIREIIGEARVEAERIISDAKKRAEAIKKAKKESIIRRMEERLRAERAIARIEGRRLVYNKKWEYVELAFKEAWRRLMEYRGGKDYYEEFIPKAILRGVRMLGLDNIVVHVNNDDYPEVSRRFNTIIRKIRRELGGNININLSRNPIDISGGVIVADNEEKIYYNLSFDARIKEAREKLTHKVFNILFGGE